MKNLKEFFTNLFTKQKMETEENFEVNENNAPGENSVQRARETVENNAQFKLFAEAANDVLGKKPDLKSQAPQEQKPDKPEAEQRADIQLEPIRILSPLQMRAEKVLGMADSLSAKLQKGHDDAERALGYKDKFTQRYAVLEKKIAQTEIDTANASLKEITQAEKTLADVGKALMWMDKNVAVPLVNPALAKKKEELMQILAAGQKLMKEITGPLFPEDKKVEPPQAANGDRPKPPQS